jgi:hypothetical protein
VKCWYCDYYHLFYFKDCVKSGTSRKQAFRDAKRENNIPIAQQPIRTTMIPDHGSNPGKMLRQYDFKNNRGEHVSIRQDLPQQYGNAVGGKGNQGHHFNAGPTGGKLKQHYYFDKFNSKRQG